MIDVDPHAPEAPATRRVRGLFAGLATLDIVSHVDRAPGPDEKVTATWQLVAAGGPALNAAVTFAALGGQALLLTRVGSGPTADVVRADLRACGVELLDVARDGMSPPVSSVTVEADGTRRVVGLDAVQSAHHVVADGGPTPRTPVAGSASPVVDPPVDTDIDIPAIDTDIEIDTDIDIVLVDGHHPDLAERALDLAGSRVPRVLDAGRWRPAMGRIVPRCTEVIASSAFRLDGVEDDVDTRLARVLDRLAGAGAGAGEGAAFAAVTAGDGAIRWRRREAGKRRRGGHPPAVGAGRRHARRRGRPARCLRLGARGRGGGSARCRRGDRLGLVRGPRHPRLVGGRAGGRRAGGGPRRRHHRHPSRGAARAVSGLRHRPGRSRRPRWALSLSPSAASTTSGAPHRSRGSGR